MSRTDKKISIFNLLLVKRVLAASPSSSPRQRLAVVSPLTAMVTLLILAFTQWFYPSTVSISLVQNGLSWDQVPPTTAQPLFGG